MPPGAPNFGRILLAIKDGDESKNEYSQLINLISSSKRSEKVGFSLHEGNKVPILQLLNLLIHSSPDVRKEAVSLLNFCYSYDDLPNGPPQDIIDEDGLEKVEKIIFPGLSELLQSSRDIYLLDSWDTIIRLLGTHLHRKTTLINAGMRVVQAAFKHTDARMVEKALRSWVVLMENFALVPEILNSSKRIKLLVMALKYDNPKQQESTYRVRLECWYELMHLLGRNLKHHAGDLVKEFVIFCFGPKSGPSSRNPGTPRTPGSPASTPSSKLHGFGTPTKQMSPAKKFSSLERVCVDSLVQLFGARPLPQTLPRPLLSKPLPEVAITPQQFGELSEIILNALEEITENIKYSNRSENLKIGVIWSGVGDLAVQLTSLPNHLEPVLNYLRSVYRVSNKLRRQEKLHSILFEILGTVIKFPDSILLSHIYSLNSMEKKE
ncbi:telomere-associated protein RIF1, partial [Eurytemora carolleeae]|uniref:telomere-associated protein RIF1 n=1 Tax=Eurytemora carolleeae TaxID=1294199 RepID=UPI000C77CF77